MMFDNFFRDVGIKNAPTQSKMIDAVTEEANILAMIPMQDATHGLRNVYEELVDVDGAQLVSLDDELPSIGATSTLKSQDLSVLGGQIWVGEDKANAFGGAASYFASKMPSILRKTGQDTEYSLLYNVLRPYANNNSKELDAGGTTASSQYSIICVKWVEGETTGLYDAAGFGNGKVFDIRPITGGQLTQYTDDDSNVLLGYGERIKAYFALQLANSRNVSSIVNIELTADTTSDTGFKALPTESQMDDLIINTRGSSANTFLYMHPKVLSALGVYKGTALSMNPSDKGINRMVASWNEIPIITSYNFKQGTEAVVS